MSFFEVAHAAEEGISIHLAPTVIGHLFGIPITNTLLTVWLSMLIIIALAFFIRTTLTYAPGRFQAGVEAVIAVPYDYMVETLGSRNLARKFFPLIMTLFLFILIMNWVGLLPFVDTIGFHGTTEHEGETVSSFIPFFHPAATDLNIPIAFAIISVLAIQVAGIFLLGFWKYGGKFINFSSPLNFVIGIIELISEIARLITFSFRLFGNIFAGKTLLLVVLFFVPFVLPVPLLAYEVFVGLIQAFVFAFLTLLFIKLAVEEPHH